MKKISRKNLLLWRVHATFVTIVLEILAFALLKEYPFVRNFVAFLFASAFLSLFFIYFPVKYNRTRYATQDGTLLIKGGVIYRFEKRIPLQNIQYISFVAGPIERILNLETALIFTAGAMTRFGSLDRQGAQNLQNLVMQYDV